MDLILVDENDVPISRERKSLAISMLDIVPLLVAEVQNLRTELNQLKVGK